MESAQHMLRTGRRGTLFEFSMALRDLITSWDRRGLAWSLAWHDVVSRYRGSILGPFWITISMGLMVLGIGLLYARLFGISVAEFMPYVAMGIVFFGLMSGTINEGCDTFVHAANMLSQTALPMFTFVWRTVLRNLINLAHHAVIIISVIVIFGLWRVADPLLALGGLVLTVLNLSWISLLVAIASARFRDIPQFVMSVMQFAIFMTPVFWKPDAFPDRHAFLTLNPFYHMLTTIRAPLLGEQPDGLSYIVLAIAAVLGWALTFSVFAVTRRRIVHYL
ncbi:ABC transporter permease [Phenylobacterium sp.]|uniref:ABC transporter permease n=1 Tax=Phenylobacterium sp. TaxID=1871053 RepID=UPI00261F8F6E|nr:ABC transporter permease [Phenylobacterium sp.]